MRIEGIREHADVPRLPDALKPYKPELRLDDVKNALSKKGISTDFPITASLTPVYWAIITHKQ